VKLELEEVRSQLEKALKARNKEKVAKKFIEWMFKNILTPDNIVEAIQSKMDLTITLRENCYLDNELIQPIAKMVMRLYWKEIEDVLCNVDKVYELLLKIASEHSETISSNEGINYLNQQCERLYNYLYTFVWGEGE
jgi:hypothetical protein